MRYNTTNSNGREVQAVENSKSSLKSRLYEAMTIRGKKSVDLTRDLGIPKSAVSQYLSGKSQKMDSERLYAIAKYLDVDEPWLLGYDVPMKIDTGAKKEQPIEYDRLPENRKEFIYKVAQMSDAEFDRLTQILSLVENTK